MAPALVRILGTLPRVRISAPFRSLRFAFPVPLEPAINSNPTSLRLKHLVVKTPAGKLDFTASKMALYPVIVDAAFDTCTAVMLDLRGVDCEISVTDIFNFAEYLACPGRAPGIYKKVAVVIDLHAPGQLTFNRAQFQELCASNGRRASLPRDA